MNLVELAVVYQNRIAKLKEKIKILHTPEVYPDIYGEGGMVSYTNGVRDRTYYYTLTLIMEQRDGSDIRSNNFMAICKEYDMSPIVMRDLLPCEDRLGGLYVIYNTKEEARKGIQDLYDYLIKTNRV